MFLFAFLECNDLNFHNSSIDIFPKYVCIATALYIRLYLYNFHLSFFSFCLIYIENIVDSRDARDIYFLFSFSLLQPLPIWCIMSEHQYIRRMFLNFGKSEAKCFYKLGSYKKTCTCVMSNNWTISWALLYHASFFLITVKFAHINTIQSENVKDIPPEHMRWTERTKDVQRTFWMFSEHLLYVQFTWCGQGLM